MIPDFNFGES